jgi:hypothetical protein
MEGFMKKLLIFIPLMGLGFVLFGQSLNPEVIASSGDYFENTNASLGWTLGETVTESFANGNIFLTQGFQQPVTGIAISGIDLDLLVYLEGPYEGPHMQTGLNTAGLIPLSQPFDQPPWDYSGDETVVSIPNMDVVDWLLIELRDATDAASAGETTVIARQAGFLLKDGSVVGTDGSSTLQFDNSFAQQLFVVVWHRNHLGIMTANGVTESAGVYVYDFSTGASQAYGNNAGYKDIGGVWGMVAGNGNHDGIINLNDKNQWTSYAGQKGYLDSDYNLDAQVNNPDKNDMWNSNQTFTSQIPQ